MSEIFIIEWHNESGDRGTLGYWTTRPTPEQVKQILAEWSPDDVREDGEFFIYGEVKTLSLQNLPGLPAPETIHLAVNVVSRDRKERSKVFKLDTSLYDRMIDSLTNDMEVRAFSVYEVRQTLCQHHKTYTEDLDRFANMTVDSNGNFVDIPATPSKLLA